MAMTMMTMAVMSTEDHVPQGQDTKQTQHCYVPPFHRFACTIHLVRVDHTILGDAKTGFVSKNMEVYFSNVKTASIVLLTSVLFYDLFRCMRIENLLWFEREDAFPVSL